MSSSHCEQYVNIERIYAVLKILKLLGNPFYQDINDNCDAYHERFERQQKIGLDQKTMIEGSLVEIAVMIASLHEPPVHIKEDQTSKKNCIFSACINQLGRSCFEKAQHCMPDDLRHLTTLYLKTCNTAYEMSGVYKRKWLRELNFFYKTGNWTFCNKSILLTAICVVLKKQMLIINTISTPEDPPTYLLCPSRYNEKADTYSPLLFAHDGESFQSLLPKSEDDETRLVYLMTQHRSGGYQVKVKDLINKQEQISKNELIDKGLIDNIDNEVPEENNISDEEDNYEQNDPIQRQKFSYHRCYNFII